MNNKLIDEEEKILLSIIYFTEFFKNILNFFPDPDPLFPGSGSADPDPHQNEVVQHHCKFEWFPKYTNRFYFLTYLNLDS